MQTLRQDIQLLNEKNNDLKTELKKESLAAQKTQRKLSEEQHASASRDRKYRSNINELQLSIDMERARQLEITK